MTPALWWFLSIQALLVLGAFGLCRVRAPNRPALKRLERFGIAALLTSLAVSGLTYVSALVLSFGASDSPSEKAAQLATHITTMMNTRWLAIVFAILIGVSLKVQDARRGSLPSAPDSLLRVLQEARARLALPGANFVPSGWDDQAQALAELDKHIAQATLEQVDRAEVSLLFAPTGSLQEFSLANGWGREFVELSRRCDACLAGPVR